MTTEYHNGYGCTNERREVQRSTGWSKDERGKPAPAPEPKRGSEEPIDEVMHRISHAEDDMQCHGYLDPVRKEIAALRAQLAENKREIAELAALVPALATERAARKKEKAHFAEQWTMEEGRFLEMLHRAEKAEARVSDLERSIVDWETEPQYRVTNLNQLHRVAKDILAARANQGESRAKTSMLAALSALPDKRGGGK